MNEERCYGKKIKINKTQVRNFWDGRARNIKNLSTVLLGNQKNADESVNRNQKEFLLVDRALGRIENFSVLDIGCGMGRWAQNLKDRNCRYTGIDFSSEFIQYDKKQYPNMNFFCMKAENIVFSELEDQYEFIIVNGVLMYINDEDIGKVFDAIKIFNPRFVYMQESVSIMGKRLTLNNFYSTELEKRYSSIYRKPKDYEILIENKLQNYKILCQGFLLEEKNTDETNAKYWVLERDEL